MKTHPPVATTTAGLGFAALTLLLSSCAGPRYTAMDHRDYTKMPECTSSKLWRGIAKSNPWTAKAAFHGRWGGSGNVGGEPVDVLDEGFRRHDIVYYESRCGEHLKAADRELVEWLENLDEDTLDERQLKYRKRAIKFLTSPLANVVGKPPAVMLRKKERDGCHFTSVEVVDAFFDPNGPGFPYASPAPEVSDQDVADDPILLAEEDTAPRAGEPQPSEPSDVSAPVLAQRSGGVSLRSQ